MRIILATFILLITFSSFAASDKTESDTIKYWAAIETTDTGVSVIHFAAFNVVEFMANQDWFSNRYVFSLIEEEYISRDSEKLMEHAREKEYPVIEPVIDYEMLTTSLDNTREHRETTYWAKKETSDSGETVVKFTTHGHRSKTVYPSFNGFLPIPREVYTSKDRLLALVYIEKEMTLLGDTYTDGSEYVGEFNGQGTYTYTNGAKYVGEFKDDKFNGQGTYTYTNGTKYVGEFKDGKRNGQGVVIYSDGSRKTGHWILGEYVGE